MKKSTWIILFAAIFCLATFSACNNSESNKNSGELEFVLYNYSREYQVAGIGTFNGDKITVPAKYNGKKVTSIGENAFAGSAITEIVFPDTVTEICAGAFSDCFALKKITLPSGIETVQENVFKGANVIEYTEFGGGKYLGNSDNPHLLLVENSDSGAKEITIHQSTKIIGNSAFYDCNGIGDLIIPNATEKIEDYAFYGCDNLVSVTLGSGLKKIEDHAFLDCNKIVEVFDHSSLNVKKGQRTATGYVAYNALKVYAGDAESNIVTDGNGFKIFIDGKDKVLVGYDGTGSDVTLPEGITAINKRAFYENENIVSISIQSGLKEVAMQAFYGCEKLQTVNLPDTVQIIGQQVFFNCVSLKNISFGNQLSEIGDYAFSGCVALESISLPSTLTDLGNAPFAGCIGLKSFEMDELNPDYKTVNGVLYSKDGANLVQYPTGAGQTEFIIPDTVSVIGASAFEGAKNLTSVTVGSAVTIIDSGAFKNSSIEEIAFKSKNTLKAVGSSAFYGCKNLTAAILPDTVNSLGESAFYRCESLSQVKIDGIESIGQSTFYGCKSLQEITIPDSVGSIGAKAFSGCESLAKVNIGDGSAIYGFGEYCFENCKSLTEINIPKKTQNIQKWAFSGCENLTYMYFKETSGWWAWNKGVDEIGATRSVLDPEKAAKQLAGYYSKYLWQCSTNSE